MSKPGADEATPSAADASLDTLVQTLVQQAGRTLGVDALACATATVRGVDRWLAAGSVAVARCDGAQDRPRQGPRYLARRTGEPVVVRDLVGPFDRAVAADDVDDDRWPVWAHACRVQGFRSAAVVVGTHRDVTVHLGLYARQVQPWERVLDRGVALAQGIASVVAVREEVVALAQAMDDLLDCTRSRELMDQAVGVVMAERGCDAATAMAVLTSASTHRDVRDLAAELVARRSGRAGAGPAVARSVREVALARGGGASAVGLTA